MLLANFKAAINLPLVLFKARYELILSEYRHIQKTHYVRFQGETCLMLDRTITFTHLHLRCSRVMLLFLLYSISRLYALVHVVSLVVQ